MAGVPIRFRTSDKGPINTWLFYWKAGQVSCWYAQCIFAAFYAVIMLFIYCIGDKGGVLCGENDWKPVQKCFDGF